MRVENEIENRTGSGKRTGTGIRKTRAEWYRLRRRWVAAGMAAFLFCGSCHFLQEVRLQKEIAAGVVRFHIRADSDRTEDQQRKLQVRDAVSEELKTILTDAGTKAETEEILRKHETGIQAAAEQTLRAGGCSDPVTVTYGKAWFEEKESGPYRLPAGRYDALQISIGQGKGHNWWCMLYPSICFFDAMSPVEEELTEKTEAMKDLEKGTKGTEKEKTKDEKNDNYKKETKSVEKEKDSFRNVLSDAAYREILKSDRVSFDFFWF